MTTDVQALLIINKTTRNVISWIYQDIASNSTKFPDYDMLITLVSPAYFDKMVHVEAITNVITFSPLPVGTAALGPTVDGWWSYGTTA
jgi:hypothetical protein